MAQYATAAIPGMITVDGQDGASSDGGSLKLLKPCKTQCISSPAKRRSIMTTRIDFHNDSATTDNTRAQWNCHYGETRNSASPSPNATNTRHARITAHCGRKPQSDRLCSYRRDKRSVLQPEKRRSRLPKTFTGRKFQYDSTTAIQPIEITPRSPNWNNVPRNQRHTRNYYLRFLSYSVRGQTVFSHDDLESRLQGKREIK